MPRTQDGSGYGYFGGPRRQGPTIASRKGALAIVVRSIGTDYHRNPHTGAQQFAAGVAPIPWLLEGSLDDATPLPGTAYKVEIASALVGRARAGVA